MTPYEQQAAEIKTIKPREFKLNLSDADVERLFKEAYSNGITPEKLIEGYLGDLLCGTHSNGIYERALAREYFKRCDYSMGLVGTFLQWTLKAGKYDDLIENMWYFEDHFCDMDVYYDDKGDPTPIFDEGMKTADKVIHDYYHLYCEDKKRNGEVPQAYFDGYSEIFRYEVNLRQMLEGSAPEAEPDAENDCEQFEP